MDPNSYVLAFVYKCWHCIKTFPKSSHKYIMNPLALFAPIFGGIAFSIDPYNARNISRRLLETIIISLDYSDQVTMSTRTSTTNKN